MLSALELAGFKSFADRTRFDFPEGITVIVGPNGSGKSNVVDAIKWVLGAQSAKALRGKDMIDVIFKGSESSGRKPANCAEATLVFDNSGKQLAVESEEVHVTRRVYRSGEGEYLINNQACRLKDIKNLFRGTGVGVDAYSLIEQGKVDRMLQASPKDRRVIFEEAAGISRFNAKKAEANRRLHRVEQNLTRLRDIVNEVHTRLNSLKNQATKAQRYREMTTRLHELRLQLGRTEFLELQQKIETLTSDLAQVEGNRQQRQQELNEATDAARQAEMELHRVAEACQEVEGRLQEASQCIAVSRNQQDTLRVRLAESTEDATRKLQRLVTMRARANSLQQELDAIIAQAQQAQGEYDDAKQRAEVAAEQASSLQEELTNHSRVRDELRQKHVALLKDASEQSATVAKNQNQLQELATAIAQLDAKIQRNRQAESEARATAEKAAEKLGVIAERNRQATEAFAQARASQQENQAQLVALQEENALIQGRLAATNERLELLEQLEQHLDGVDSGARFLLAHAKTQTHQAYASVHGLVADLVDVNVDLAAMIDTALGPAANALVIADGALIQLIRSGELEVPGKLSLIRLDRLPNRRFGEKVQLDGVDGVIGRADRLVQCEESVLPLVRYLLGTTWLVDSLDIALDLGHFRGAGLRFVASTGQLIEADGTLTLGAMQASPGLISRRSEIQSARDELADLKEKYQATRGQLERTRGRLQGLTPEIERLEKQAKELSQEFARQQANAQAAVAKLDGIEVDAGLLNAERQEVVAKREELGPTIEREKIAIKQLQDQLQVVEADLVNHESSIQTFANRLKDSIAEETSAKVALARMEQKLASARGEREHASRAQAERQQQIDELQQELNRLKLRWKQDELKMLELTGVLAEAFLRKESEERTLDELATEALTLRDHRTRTAKQLSQAQKQLDKLTQQETTSQLELERFSDAARQLLKRYGDDYQIDLNETADSEPLEEESDRGALDAEASRLRQDIASVGEINMAALAELDELQLRYDNLHGQYEDLVAAKESLQRIIVKINQDSRRMFMETLEIIRQNFQKLYRKSFGGGNADIVLEEGEDVLECGIDIIATPPGKTALSNSLLSGGEKALTAVALLLAIFQYRPSPFCVLDEVDAPFDEANIGRFVSVLTEFLDWTKFIIVTHSKKTMTASTTLYGVTMQESGVSKQVAVRFEDVNDKGEIKQPTRRAA